MNWVELRQQQQQRRTCACPTPLHSLSAIPTKHGVKENDEEKHWTNINRRNEQRRERNVKNWIRKCVNVCNDFVVCMWTMKVKRTDEWMAGWTDGMARDRLDLTIWLGPYTRRQKTAHAALWWCLLDHDLHHYHRSRTNRMQGGTQRHCSMILNLSHPHTHTHTRTHLWEIACVCEKGG